MEQPLKLATDLRNLNVKTEIFLNDKKIKAKMKYADKLEIPYVVVIGENEVETNKVKVKNMATGEEIETELNAENIANIVRK
jgi:histidyl-tRNA synthetase